MFLHKSNILPLWKMQNQRRQNKMHYPQLLMPLSFGKIPQSNSKNNHKQASGIHHRNNVQCINDGNNKSTKRSHTFNRQTIWTTQTQVQSSRKGFTLKRSTSTTLESTELELLRQQQRQHRHLRMKKFRS